MIAANGATGTEIGSGIGAKKAIVMTAANAANAKSATSRYMMPIQKHGMSVNAIVLPVRLFLCVVLSFRQSFFDLQERVRG